ncbi:MAG TPA: MATE family efflux transporter [Candidatus Egerieimonas faecigallinarum]|nr:MATE family efflux transporter [Candidatus Egerieimonas faecigallinarum]
MLFSKKDLTKLLIPLIIEQLLAVAVGMVDVAMVSVVGENAVSGVSLVDSITILIIQLLSALATGGAVVSSQYLGQKNTRKACQSAGQLILVTTVASAALALISLLFNYQILSLVFGNVEAEVMTDAMIYFRITAVSYPFLAVYNSCAALYRSMGNSKVSMFVSLIMNGINIAGNSICIFALHMGVEGVAYPTLISRVAAAVIMMFLIQSPKNVIRINSLKDFAPHRKMIGSILGVGIPNGLENSIFQIGKLTLQSLVSSLGTTAIAGYAVACNLATLEYLPGNAIGLGLITVVGRCVGAGEYQQAKQYTKKLILLNYAFLAVICTAMFFGSNLFVGIYSLSPEAAAGACEMIMAHSVAMIIWPIAFTLANTLRASFDAKFTMCISVGSMWIFRVFLAYIFVTKLNMGIMGVWYGMFLDWIFRAAAFLLRFRTYGKRRLPDLN